MRNDAYSPGSYESASGVQGEFIVRLCSRLSFIDMESSKIGGTALHLALSIVSVFTSQNCHKLLRGNASFKTLVIGCISFF